MPAKRTGRTTRKAAKTKRAKTTRAKKTTAKKKRPARTPSRRASGEAAAGQRLRVKQVRSSLRRDGSLGRTLRALGLKHHQDEVVVTDTPSIRGMLQRVHHLIRVTPEGSS